MVADAGSKKTTVRFLVSNDSSFPASGAGPVSSGFKGSVTATGGRTSYLGWSDFGAESRIRVTTPFCLSKAMARPYSTLPTAVPELAHPAANTRVAKIARVASDFLVNVILRAPWLHMNDSRLPGALGPLGVDPLQERDQDVELNRRHHAEDENGRRLVGDGLDGGEHGREDLHDDGEFTANDGYAKENPNTVTFDVLGGDGADLGSNGSAQQHDQSGYDFDAAFVTVGSGSVETGDGNLKKIGADGDVGRDAQQVNQGGHADQAAANPEHTRQPAGKEADPDGQPWGTANAGALEIDHGRDIDFLQPLVPLMASGHGVQFLAHS